MGGVISIRMPAAVLDALKKSRGKRINNQLMDSLILLSNSLRSGMDIVQGFELVSKDMLPPIADEFGLVVKNYQLGTPFEKRLTVCRTAWKAVCFRILLKPSSFSARSAVT